MSGGWQGRRKRSSSSTSRPRGDSPETRRRRPLRCTLPLIYRQQEVLSGQHAARRGDRTPQNAPCRDAPRAATRAAAARVQRRHGWLLSQCPPRPLQLRRVRLRRSGTLRAELLQSLLGAARRLGPPSPRGRGLQAGADRLARRSAGEQRGLSRADAGGELLLLVLLLMVLLLMVLLLTPLLSLRARATPTTPAKSAART